MHASTTLKFSRAGALGLALTSLTVAGCSGGQTARPEGESTATVHPAPAPDHGAQGPVQDEAPHRAREIPLIELRNESSPLVTFRIVFESGSADDPSGREGVTHLAARLMAEGGTEALTYEQLTRQLFPMAATIGFQIDRDMTVFVGQVHRDHLAAFYPLLRDVLLHPRMGQEDFERVRAQDLSELTQDLRGGDDEALGKEFLQTLLYPNHPYGHPTLGTETALAAITLDDARSQRAHVFCRDRVAIGLAGGYPAELAATVRADMASLPAECAPAVQLPAVTRPHGLHVVLIDKPSASATAISMGYPIDVRRGDPDFAAVQFITNLIGLHRQSSGLLYQTIREARGLNYGDYMYSEYFEQEGYNRFPAPNIQRRSQFASVWLRPLRPPTAHFALRAAIRAISRTLEAGVSQPEFERTRTFLDGYVSLFTQTESARLGYALDDWYDHLSGPPYADRMRGAWDALDAAGATAAARRHLYAQDAWVALVAPNARELAAAIGSNAPSPITYESPKPAEVTAEDAEIAAFQLAVRPEDVRVVPLADVFHQ